MKYLEAADRIIEVDAQSVVQRCSEIKRSFFTVPPQFEHSFNPKRTQKLYRINAELLSSLQV